MARSRRSPQPSRRTFFRELAHDFAEHRLFIYATSIGFRALVALIPLALLALGLLGALGLQSTWRNSIAPAIRPQVTQPVFHGIDYTAKKILSSGTAGLIVFAAALVLWDLVLAILGIMEALNRIHDIEDKRPLVERGLTALGLAVLSGVCFVGAFLIITVAPRAQGDVTHFVLGVGRWLVATVLLAVIVGAVMHLGPAQRPEKRWASAGSLLIIAVWILASLLFKLWVMYVANFKSPIGSLTALLFLSWYVFVSSAIFLVGAQIDELLRKEARRSGSSRLVTLLHGRS